MLARVCLTIACLAGCDRLFGLPHIDADAGGDLPIDARDSGGFSCPAGYDMQSTVSPSRYRYVASNTSWDAGLVECGTHDPGRTHLIVLTDDSERLDMLALLAAKGVTSSFWIGLSDRRLEGAFQWVTDEPVGMPPLSTPPWGAGQPDDQGGTQDCTRVQGASHASAGLFDDAECSADYPYLCECDGIAPEPANY